MCEYCEIVGKKRNAIILYEDDLSIVFLKNSKHMVTIPKQHYVILEQLPNDLFAYLLTITNRISSILFESMKCQGTNLLVQNGDSAGQKIQHFSINTFFRYDHDDYNFNWAPVQTSKEELLNAQEELVDGIKVVIDSIKHKSDKNEKPKEHDKKEMHEIISERKNDHPKKDELKEPVNKEHEEVDYRIKQLIRIP